VPTLEFALDLPGVTQRAIWDFHGDPAVLEWLTPPEKDLRVIERPARLGRGARVVLDVRQSGIRLRWISSFAEWEPPVRFVDVQEKGPFASWRHEHLFANGRLVDRITYEVPLARFGGRLVDRLLVRPDVVRMFAYRHAVTRQALLR
jgi:ligand-binding SRPBCC domain-containing protein